MRLIDADTLKESMDETLMPGKDVVLETYIDEVVCAVIDDAPAVDAVAVKHACIELVVAGNGIWYECSNCHNVSNPRWKICPYCSTSDCATMFIGVCEDETPLQS